MNAYRVALILCRAVVIALWWNVGLSVLSVIVTLITAQLNSQMSFGNLSLDASFYVDILTLTVPQVVAAIFLQVFAVSLSSAIVGASAFDGEPMASRPELNMIELNLARAGAGLYLLFFA